MRVSMERLLGGVVDFAGTFPPAKLSLSDSLPRYLGARSGPGRRLLGRFVCATAHLGDLSLLLAKTPAEEPLPVSAIGMPSFDPTSWEDARAQDAEAMNAFYAGVGSAAQIEAYEVRVPETADIDACVRDLRGFAEAEVFVELPINERIDDSLARLADSDDLGAKLRTGGLEVSAIPSARSLAQFLRTCVDLEMAFKLTAGLHHPLPRYDPSIKGRTHGFVNALTATALALTEDLSRREIETVLLDEDPASWRFDDRAMSWREFRVDLAGIGEARELFVAFGSCSIDEPLEGLRIYFAPNEATVK